MSDTIQNKTIGTNEILVIVLSVIAAIFTIVNFNILNGSVSFSTGFSAYKFCKLLGPVILAIFVLVIKKPIRPLFLIPAAMPFIAHMVSATVSSTSGMAPGAILIDLLVLIIAVAFIPKKNNFTIAVIIAALIAVVAIFCLANYTSPFGYKSYFSSLKKTISMQFVSELIYYALFAFSFAFAAKSVESKTVASLGESQHTTEISSGANASVSQTSPSISTDDLFKLKSLLDSGAITQEEFDEQKKKMLGL